MHGPCETTLPYVMDDGRGMLSRGVASVLQAMVDVPRVTSMSLSIIHAHDDTRSMMLPPSHNRVHQKQT